MKQTIKLTKQDSEYLKITLQPLLKEQKETNPYYQDKAMIQSFEAILKQIEVEN